MARDYGTRGIFVLTKGRGGPSSQGKMGLAYIIIAWLVGDWSLLRDKQGIVGEGIPSMGAEWGGGLVVHKSGHFRSSQFYQMSMQHITLDLNFRSYTREGTPSVAVNWCGYWGHICHPKFTENISRLGNLWSPTSLYHCFVLPCSPAKLQHGRLWRSHLWLSEESKTSENALWCVVGQELYSRGWTCGCQELVCSFLVFVFSIFQHC